MVALLAPADWLRLSPSPYKDLEETLRIAGAEVIGIGKKDHLGVEHDVGKPGLAEVQPVVERDPRAGERRVAGVTPELAEAAVRPGAEVRPRLDNGRIESDPEFVPVGKLQSGCRRRNQRTRCQNGGSQ